MNLPKIEICIEGYDIEQTDFYLSMLIEKNENLTGLYEDAVAQINSLSEINEKLHKDFINLARQFSDAVSSTDSLIIEKLSNIERKMDLILSDLNFNKISDDISLANDNLSQIANDKTDVNREISDLRDNLAELKSLIGTTL